MDRKAYPSDLSREQFDAIRGLLEQARHKTAPHRKGEFCILDAQSVMNADTARSKGYDAGKKVSGIKRHLAASGGI